MAVTALDEAEILAIVEGRHRDPFRVLGPHRNETGGWEIRAWLPQAAEASVLEQPMERIGGSGFFVATFAREPVNYRISIALYSGERLEFEDPYRFPPLLSSFDLHLYGEGTHYESWRTLGSHPAVCEGVAGVRFAVWAPNAEVVSLTGDFNGWDVTRHPMRLRDGGIWEFFLPEHSEGTAYKYAIRSSSGVQLKADPYAFYSEVPPKTASVVWNASRYQWGDDEWMAARRGKDLLKSAVSIYEVHLESWMRGPHNRSLTYRELAVTLVEYAVRMGYTHVEFLPVMEHPFSGSWGYQVTGFFAPTSRFGTPDDFRFLIDRCHQAGLGVLCDWVPGHFPRDAHGLARFDGTALYEHEDPRLGEHKDWGTLVFNYGRNEVRTFLISNAMFWLTEFHVDGLRVDAVASMLYLDYARNEGEWIPNIYGGRENLEAIDFLRRFNELAHTVEGAITIAEESTSFAGVSHPVWSGGLGFTMKWNMGWMHDMFAYFKRDAVHRKYHHNNITFSLLYAFTENFVLPVSHDEVVHLKSSLLGKMRGDEWQRFANVRSFLGYMYAHPGKKLLFMGCEMGQPWEWNHDESVPWNLLVFDYHRKLQQLCAELNRLYRSEPALHEVDYNWTGFEWVDLADVDGSTISFIRYSENRKEFVVFCCNFTPVVRHGYSLGVPEPGAYREILNTDDGRWGGSGVMNGLICSHAVSRHGRPHSLTFTMPPMAVVAFKIAAGS